MATAFRLDCSFSVQSSVTDRSKVSKPDKIGRKSQPFSNVAMSILSGDINDGSSGSTIDSESDKNKQRSHGVPDKVV